MAETEQKSEERIFNKRPRYPPPEPRDSDIGSSEGEIAELQRVFEVPTRKKQKVRSDQTKVVEAESINTLNGAALVNQLVTSPQASTQLNVSSHPSSPRTSKPPKKTFSSSFNSEPNSCTHTSDLPTPVPHNSKSRLTAQSRNHLLRQEARASGHQPDGQSELTPNIGLRILEEVRNIRQDVKSLNDRVKSLEETPLLTALSSRSSTKNSLDDPNLNKVLLDRGVMISPSALDTITTTGDLNEFITALLLGVFDEEEAKLYRLYPRDASNKAFPQNFIEVAKSQYARFLERQGQKPPYGKGILNKVLALLSRKATDLGGRRNTGYGKRKSEAASSCSTEYVVDPTTGQLATNDGEAVVLVELPLKMSLTEPRAADEDVENEPTIEIVTDEESE